MGNVFVLAEHRQGVLREITLEMLTKAAAVAGQTGGEVVTVLLGSGVDAFAEKAAGYCDRVLYMDTPLFADYSAEKYQKALAPLLRQYKPELFMIGHTTQGVDLAPALAVELKLPFVSDVIDINVADGKLKPVRQYYQGKVNANFAFKGEPPYLVTFREATLEVGDAVKGGSVEKIPSTLPEDIAYRRFIEYVEAEVGDVDITQSEILVAVGRGVKEDKNMPLIEGLAAALKADICGSRAAIDAGWLSHDRQVGTSGKTVKPKLYIAIGVSGAFQHLAGMKGAKTIVAINKDPDAPIFSVADFGIVDDLFKVVPKLTEKLKELKS
ncbi:MAG TPA: electron transfer flavoprotein subunit alpha/FixB family protein [Firmicutes bacterium]|nr:electron transfer flavoprotein subunit alpha/FixB family protein [Bacillota bacterium]